MNKRTDLLDKIRDECINAQSVGAAMFLRTLCDYYAKNDLETGDQLSDIFYALYMSSEYLSYDEIVYKFSIGLTTLHRYRRRFNELARKLLPIMQVTQTAT